MTLLDKFLASGAIISLGIVLDAGIETQFRIVQHTPYVYIVLFITSLLLFIPEMKSCLKNIWGKFVKTKQKK